MTDAREQYGDIIDMEHHEPSPSHPRMSRSARAAQFAPFAALTGYEDLISESSRATEARTELDEAARDDIDRRLGALLASPEPRDAVFTCFVLDGRKSGGRYIKVSGTVTGYSEQGRFFTLSSGETVFVDDITDVSIPGED